MKVNTNNNRQISRWGIITAIAVLVILLVGTAIFAQGMNRRPGDRQGPGMQGGMGRGMGPDQGMGPGFGQGQRPGMGGPQAIFGMQFMMQDPDIIELVGQIKVIEGLNRLDMTVDQVEELRSLAIEAQEIMDDEFGGVRDDIKVALGDQLESVLAGNETEPEQMRGIIEGVRDEHDMEALRGEFEEILNQALDLLTDEQREQIRNNSGPGGDQIRERLQEFGEGRGQGWLEDLTDEQRERIGNRMGEMREGAARMKVMMLLLSPQAVESMELWLEYN